MGPVSQCDSAKTQAKKKKAELAEALTGRVKGHHRLLLRELLDQIDYLEGAIARLDGEIEERLRPFEGRLAPLDDITGVAKRTIEDVVAEIRVEMGRFASNAHLASWAGVCPGNNESAGKRLSGRTRRGSPWLRGALVQAAWAAASTKSSYFRSQFVRLKARRGAKRAIVAVAHSLLVTIYEMLRRGTPYADLGADHFDRLQRTKIANRLVKRLRELGYAVEVTEPAA